jgi:hypothetical protein
MKKLLGLFVTALFALSACGGNNAGIAPSPTGLVPAAASNGAASADHRRHRKLVRTKFFIKVPRRHKRKHKPKHGAASPAYISPSSQSITIVLNTVNGNSPPSGLLTSATTNLSGCSSGCTVYGPSVPPGSDNLSLTIYDAANGSGNVLSQATKTFTITPGQANSPTVTLEGVPHSFTIGTLASATAGTAFSPAQAFTVTVKDFDGNTITGTYANAVTVADSDASGASTLSVNSGAASTSVQLTKDSDTIALGYSGLAIVPATISVSAAGATTASAGFTPTLNAIGYTCNGGGAGDTTECDPTLGQIDLYAASGTGSSATFTLSEIGWSNSPYDKTFTATPGGSCSTIGTVSTTDHLTFTATTAASPSAGSCIVTMNDGAGQSYPVTLTYTTSGIGINSKHYHRAVRATPPHAH